MPDRETAQFPDKVASTETVRDYKRLEERCTETKEGLPTSDLNNMRDVKRDGSTEHTPTNKVTIER